MEKSHNIEPNPDLYYYGRKYSELMDRLDSIRNKFIQDRKVEDLKDSEIKEAIQNFETEKIEQILSGLKNKNYPWHGHSKDAENASFFDSSGDTFIDTELKTVYRAENTDYREDAPTQVEIGRFYSIDPLGKIQVSSNSSSEDIEDELESEFDPLRDSYAMEDENIDRLESVQLDLDHAKNLTEMLKELIDGLEKEYSNPDWYILPHSINETSPHNSKRYFVIEKAQTNE